MGNLGNLKPHVRVENIVLFKNVGVSFLRQNVGKVLVNDGVGEYSVSVDRYEIGLAIFHHLPPQMLEILICRIS